MMLKKGQRSPWGTIQDCVEILPGMDACSTLSHGGIKLSSERNKQIPDCVKEEAGGYGDVPNGWYEEDCQVSIPYFFFLNELQQKKPDFYERAKGEIIASMKRYYPRSFAKYCPQCGKPLGAHGECVCTC